MLKIKDYIKENLFRFYSIWGLCLWLIGTLIITSGILSKYWNNLIGISLLVILIFINIVAVIIVHIYPKYLYFPVNNHYAKCYELYFIDIITHHLPLIITLLLLYFGIWNYDSNLIINAISINLCIFMVYLFLYNPFKVYLQI
jgi:hypothetical protein